MPDKLILTRRKRQQLLEDGQTVIKISNENYNKVCEGADETGLSLKKALDKLVEYACENIQYQEAEE